MIMSLIIQNTERRHHVYENWNETEHTMHDGGKVGIIILYSDKKKKGLNYLLSMYF